MRVRMRVIVVLKRNTDRLKRTWSFVRLLTCDFWSR
jgi:hypothetical protein